MTSCVCMYMHAVMAVHSGLCLFDVCLMILTTQGRNAGVAHIKESGLVVRKSPELFGHGSQQQFPYYIFPFLYCASCDMTFHLLRSAPNNCKGNTCHHSFGRGLGGQPMGGCGCETGRQKTQALSEFSTHSHHWPVSARSGNNLCKRPDHFQTQPS